MSNKTEWTSPLAYAIGLIATDGSLSKDGRHITFVSTERQLVTTFRTCLKLQNKISKRPPGTLGKKKAFRIQFGDRRFYDRLLNIGLFPNKSLTLNEVKIPDRFLPDFVRGLLDGDGSVIWYDDRYLTYKSKQYHYKRIYTKFSSASKTHLLWLRKLLKETLDLRGSLSGWMDSRGISKVRFWNLRYAKKDSLKLLPWIYYDPKVPCLRRKRTIADKAIVYFLASMRN